MRYWQMWDDSGEDDFWEYGDAVFVQYGPAGYGTVDATYRFFDVRFDPEGFGGRVPSPTADAFGGAPATPEKAPARAPSVKAARPPSDAEILVKADEMRSRGLNTYAIAATMRREPGFEHVATVEVRALIKGRYRRTGKAGIKSA